MHASLRSATLSVASLLTGCRYSELTGMHVDDFNTNASVITIRESKAGKPRHVVLTDEGQRLFASLTHAGGDLYRRNAAKPDLNSTHWCIPANRRDVPKQISAQTERWPWMT
jgi:integrase